MIRAVPPVHLAGGLLLAILTAAQAQAPQPTQVPVQPGPAQTVPAQAPRSAPAAQPSPQPSAAAPAQPRPPGGVAPSATDRIGVDQARPRTYARCNRAALRRALKGGERRRFITRCRLGYTIPPRAR